MTDSAALQALRDALDEADRHANALLERDLDQTTAVAVQRCAWRIEAAREELRDV